MLRPPPLPCGSQACPRWQSPCHINIECADAIASRLAPTVVCAVHKCCVHHHYPVGARLARDGNLPATSISNVQTPSRASPAPTVVCAVHKCCVHHHYPVGARLARDGNLPATSISNVQTPSPAGWLPQWSAPYINAASTTTTLWEQGLPAMAISLPHQCRMCRRHCQQAGSHSDLRRT